MKPKLPELQQKSKIVCATETKQAETSIITAIGTEEALKNFRLAVETTLELETKVSEPLPSQSQSPSQGPVQAQAQIPQPEIKKIEEPLHEEIHQSYPKQKSMRGRGGKVSYVKKHDNN